MDFYPFLRSLGLQLFARIPFFSLKSKAEGPKSVIRTSLPITLARSSVHILPILTSVTIISLNLGHLYLGRTIPGSILDNTITIALFQVCAKLQELLVIASLTAIVFSVIRGQLISDTGVPLGFLSSGFTFSQLNYFWSEEFWGAIGARFPVGAKISIVLLLLVAGLIAATAGPSAAVLLVPRLNDWSAGGSEFYLRGSFNELFPDVMAVSPSNLAPACFGLDATNYAMCPSGGLQSLSTYVSQHPVIRNGANIGPPPISIFGQFAQQAIGMTSLTPGVPPSTLWGTIRGVACQTAAVAPYLPAIMYQHSLRSDWETIIGSIQWNINKILTASMAEYRYNYGVTMSTSVQIPVVRTACSAGQNVSATGTTISFPVMPEYSCWRETNPTMLPELNKTPSDNLRITWVPLPSEFGAVSTGLVSRVPYFSTPPTFRQGSNFGANTLPKSSNIYNSTNLTPN